MTAGNEVYTLLRTFGGIAGEYDSILESDFSAAAGATYTPPENSSFSFRRIVPARTIQLLSLAPVVIECFQTTSAILRLPANTAAELTNDSGNGRIFVLKNSGTGTITVQDYLGVSLYVLAAANIVLICGNSNNTWDFNDASTTPFSDADFVATNVKDAIKELDFREETVEPTGFVNRFQSNMSWNNTNRTLYLGPVSTSFTFFIKGREWIKTTTDSVTITDTEGIWFFYYNNLGVLVTSQTPWDFGTEVAFVSVIYWDFTNKKAILFGEERHGLVMDWATHRYNHKVHGTQVEYGTFIAGNYITGGDGSLNSHATLSIGNGNVFDEDISMAVANSATPTLPFQQKLSTIAYLPIYYKDGSGSNWRKLDATQFPVAYQAGTTCRYNKNTAGTWGLQNATSGYIIASWIFATNNIYEPIVVVLGQRESMTLSDASSDDFYTGLDLTGFPFVEARLLYRAFFATNTGYINTPKATLQSIDGLLIPNIVPSPVVNYKVTSSTKFSTLSTTDTIITGMSITPQAGTYAVWFNADCTIVKNNAVQRTTIYYNGVAITDSLRSNQGSSSNFQTQSSTLTTITVDGLKSVDVRVRISTGQLNVNGRTLLLIRLGA